MFRILNFACTDSMGYSAGAHANLEIWAECRIRLTTLSRAAPSKTEQSCTLLGEILDSFDQGLIFLLDTINKMVKESSDF